MRCLEDWRGSRVAVMFLAMACAIILNGCAQTTAQEKNEPNSAKGEAAPLLVEPVVARVADVSSSIEKASPALSGQIEPMHVATVAAEVAAQIERRPVERGDRVSVDQLLALLDDDTARAQVAQMQAQSQQATAARRQMEAEYDRVAAETRAALRQARATEQGAQAGADKTADATRSQELRQSLAALAQARADEELAKIENNRCEKLVAEGAIAQQALDRTRATLKTMTARRESAEQDVSLASEGARDEDKRVANAQVGAARAARQSAETRGLRLATIQRQIESLRATEAQTRAAVREAEIRLRKHTIRAPFGGIVLQTSADAGDQTTPGAPLLRLGDIGRIKATFALPEADRGQFAAGQSVRITADALAGQTFAGRVTTTGFEANRADRAFVLEVVVPNAGERLLPGMVARLAQTKSSATAKSPAVVQIPVESVLPVVGGEAIVYVLQNNRAVRRAVRLGAPVGNDRVQILRGLRAGERIARTPQRLTDDAPVRVAETIADNGTKVQAK